MKTTHRCAGCNHRWDGTLTGAELCGDCWRKVMRVLHAPHDPLDLLIAMAMDWTDPVVVRDAPDRVPYVIEQLIAAIQRLRANVDPTRAATEPS